MSDYYPDPPLFSAARMEYREPKVLARPSDPPTSHVAAKRARSFASEHYRKILRALTAGPAGKSEIGRRCGLTEQQVNRRMAELRRGGLIERTGRHVESESGCEECEYRISAVSQ